MGHPLAKFVVFCAYSQHRPHNTSLLLGTIADLGRSKPELMAENGAAYSMGTILFCPYYPFTNPSSSFGNATK
jgi:hypothetical protein